MTIAFRSRLNLEHLGERIVPSGNPIPGESAPPPAQPSTSDPGVRHQIAYANDPVDDRNGMDERLFPTGDGVTLMSEPTAAERQELLREQWQWVVDLYNGFFTTVTASGKKIHGKYEKPPEVKPVVPAVDPFGPTGQPRPGILKQGGLGDCWFIGTLEGLVRSSPKTVKGMIETNADGTYTVKFPGRPPVVVTYNPCVGIGITELDKGVHHGGAETEGDGIWGRIIEQAAAQVMGHEIYNGGHATDALELLLGKGTSSYAIRREWESWSAAAGKFRRIMQDRVDDKGNATKIMTASTSHTVAGHLTVDHTYTIVGYNATTGMVRLRNPYGAGQKDHNGDPTKAPGDGVFEMSLEQFTIDFNKVCYEK